MVAGRDRGRSIYVIVEVVFDSGFDVVENIVYFETVVRYVMRLSEIQQENFQQGVR